MTNAFYSPDPFKPGTQGVVCCHSSLIHTSLSELHPNMNL